MTQVRQRDPHAQRCPLCRDGLHGREEQRCGGCETTYHQDCLSELGGCSTLGCRLQGQLPDAISHWSCRACHRPIDQALTRRNCRCGASLHDACVEAHGRGCARAAELRRRTGVPSARRRSPSPTHPAQELRRLLLAVAIAFLVTVGGIGLLMFQERAQAELLTRSQAHRHPTQASHPPAAPHPSPLRPPPPPPPSPAPSPRPAAEAAPQDAAPRAEGAAGWSIERLIVGLTRDDLRAEAGDELVRRWPAILLDLLERADVDDPGHPAVLAALEQASGRSATQVLLSACEHPELAVRRAALRAILCLDSSPATRAAATRALDSADEVVRGRAEHALVHFDPAPPIPGFDE